MADTAYSSQILTAMFDTQAEADRAVSRLKGAGIPDNSIRVTQGASGGSSMGSSSMGTSSTDSSMGSSSADASYSGTSGSTSSGAGYSDQNKGFWESLGDFFFPDEDRHTYAEGLARGGYLVTVSNFDESYYDTILDILDDEGSVDLNARESEWRSSGWSGYQGADYNQGSGGMSGVTGAVTGALGGAGAALGGALAGDDRRGTVYDDGMRGSGAVGTGTDVRSDAYGSAGDVGTGAQTTRADDQADYAGTTTGAMGTTDDGTVKVVEEHMNVGKRQVEGGRVRVRAYVREQPVEADVQLRSTRVTLERRPVNEAVNPGDMQMQDRVLEAHETAEVPVVAKEARVVEEIGLRQETETHTETVRDTVRNTEVEVEDERTGEVTRVTGDGTTGGTTGGTSGSGSTGSGY